MLKTWFTSLVKTITRTSPEEHVNPTTTGSTNTSPKSGTEPAPVSGKTIDALTSNTRDAMYRIAIAQMTASVQYHMGVALDWTGSLNRSIEDTSEIQHQPHVTHRLTVQMLRVVPPNAPAEDDEGFPADMELSLIMEEIYRSGKIIEITFVCKSHWEVLEGGELHGTLHWDRFSAKGVPMGSYARLMPAFHRLLCEVINSIPDTDKKTHETATIIPFPLR